ncbi:helix-turn-helix domain-containing protein [Spirosoma rhododendri]
MIGENVRNYRSKAALTQDQLASRIDLTRTSVAKIEKGRQHTPLHLLIDIAKALGVTLEVLIPRSTDYEPLEQIDAYTRKDIKDEDKNRFDAFYEDFLKHQRQ